MNRIVLLKSIILISFGCSAFASKGVTLYKDSTLIASSSQYDWTSWGNNHLPENSGLDRSRAFGGISFTGRYASYTNADTWYPSYATDGTIYSCCTDGRIGTVGFGNPNPRAAVVYGSDPLNLSVGLVGRAEIHSGVNGPTGKFMFGRYPSANLLYNDIWYYGTYLLEQNDRALYVPNFDWPILQPFVGFRLSSDFGETWYDHTEPDDPIFENPHEKWVNAHNVGFNEYEIMIGAPHFVDFGVNLENAPTDKKTGRKWAYMVAHGADALCDIAHTSWISGDNIYLLRILMPNGRDLVENSSYFNDPSNWQYFSKDGKYRNWNRDNLQEVYLNIKPIVDATGYLGNVGLTYNKPLGKYIMTLSRVSEVQGAFNALILEADTIDGEYRVVQYLKSFSTVSYFMNIPSKFISEDGRTMWLSYSSNYAKDHGNKKATFGGSPYSWNLTEIHLDEPDRAEGSKYEAESMELLGAAKINENKNASNLADVMDVSRLGDGVEFYSKSDGDTFEIAVSHDGKYSKQITLFVNGSQVQKLTVQASGSWTEYTIHSVTAKIHYGDKVSIMITKDDVAFNRIDGGVANDGRIITDTSYRLFGNIDYVKIK